MPRLSLQLIVALTLGVLTAATATRFDVVDFQMATVAATAASTIIAPRFWWAGLLVFWVGQSAGWAVTVDNEFATDPIGALTRALFLPYVVSARLMLIGAMLGGVLWHLVDLRRKRVASLEPMEAI